MKSRSGRLDIRVGAPGEASGLSLRGDAPSRELGAGERPRRLLGVYFECCRTYGRARPTASGDFEARCPRCLRRLRLGPPPLQEREEP